MLRATLTKILYTILLQANSQLFNVERLGTLKHWEWAYMGTRLQCHGITIHTCTYLYTRLICNVIIECLGGKFRSFIPVYM